MESNGNVSERKDVLRYLRAWLKAPARERHAWGASEVLRSVILDIENGKHVENKEG